MSAHNSTQQPSFAYDKTISAALLLLILGMLTAFGPLSIDMYLPAFPAMEASLQTSASRVQQSLSVYFLGMALGQLFYGPLSDRMGRKAPLFVGLILYALASMGCALAPDINSLIVLRFVQALGGCAGLVISRAVARDCFPPQEMARVLSLLMLIMGLAPILAPMAGSALVEYLPQALGWRSIFGVLGGLSTAALLLVWLKLPETLPESERSQAISWLHMAKSYGAILQDRSFLQPALSGVLALACLFSYITASSFVFIDYFKFSPAQYAWLFGLNAVGIIGGSQLNRRLLKFYSPQDIMPPVFTLVFAISLILGITAWTGWGHFWGVAVPLWLLLASLGLSMPNTTASALAFQTGRTGTASALLGVMQYTIAAMASLGVGYLTGHWSNKAFSMALAMLIASSLAWLSYRMLQAPKSEPN